MSGRASNSRRKRRALASSPDVCYLCGFVIPKEIVSPSHPLFGTIDHVIAKSRNGRDAVYNRAPAHRICNEAKGDRMIDPPQFALMQRTVVVPLLKRRGVEVSARGQAAALRRAAAGWPGWAPAYRSESGKAALRRWEDDGGAACGPERRKGDAPNASPTDLDRELGADERT